MFPGTSLQRIRPLKTIGTGNLHLPAIICLGADNRNPSISRTVRKHMLNGRNHLRAQRRVPRVMHLHQNRHTPLIRPRDFLHSLERASKRQLVAVRIRHVEIAFSPGGVSRTLRMKSLVAQVCPACIHVGRVENQRPHRVTGSPCSRFRIGNGASSVRSEEKHSPSPP